MRLSGRVLGGPIQQLTFSDSHDRSVPELVRLEAQCEYLVVVKARARALLEESGSPSFTGAPTDPNPNLDPLPGQVGAIYEQLREISKYLIPARYTE